MLRDISCARQSDGGLAESVLKSTLNIWKSRLEFIRKHKFSQSK